MGFIRTAIATPLELSGADEALLHSQPHVRVYLSATDTLGPGTLHITTKRVLWLPDAAQPAGRGYGVDFPRLLMHALSRDTAAFPHSAIYCQLDQAEEADGDEDDGGDGDEDDEKESVAAARGGDETEAEVAADELTKAAEVRLVPDDEAALETLYAKLSEGAELNPDEEREGEGEFFDAASLQCAPGFNIQALMAGGSEAGEYAGEELEEGEEGEDEEDAAADVDLAVTGHAIHSTGGQEGAVGAVEPEVADDDDVNMQHHDSGDIIFKR